MRRHVFFLGLVAMFAPALWGQSCPTTDTSAGCECEFRRLLDEYVLQADADGLTTLPAPTAGTCTSSMGKPRVSIRTGDGVSPRVAFQATFSTDTVKHCRIQVLDENGEIDGLAVNSDPTTAEALPGGEAAKWKKYLKGAGCALAEMLVPPPPPPPTP